MICFQKYVTSSNIKLILLDILDIVNIKYT